MCPRSREIASKPCSAATFATPSDKVALAHDGVPSVNRLGLVARELHGNRRATPARSRLRTAVRRRSWSSRPGSAAFLERLAPGVVEPDELATSRTREDPGNHLSVPALDRRDVGALRLEQLPHQRVRRERERPPSSFLVVPGSRRTVQAAKSTSFRCRQGNAEQNREASGINTPSTPDPAQTLKRCGAILQRQLDRPAVDLRHRAPTWRGEGGGGRAAGRAARVPGV